MTGPSVDVAIPTHAEPRYLAAAIESVLAQTYENLTLTVFDNSLGGGPAEGIVRRYAHDARLRYEVGGGVPVDESWTRCIRTGSAPYVALLPHDETWDGDYLARRVDFLERHPECGYAFSACRVLDGDGEILTETPHPVAAGVHQPQEFIPKLYERNLIPTCSILVRRAAYDAVGARFSAEWRMGQDWEMWLRIAVRYPVGYLAVRDNAGRIHEQSVSAASRRWGEMHLRMIARADELIARDLPGLTLSPRVRARRLAFAHVKYALDSLEEGDPASARRALREALAADPRTLMRIHAIVAVAGLHGGEPMRRAIARLRRFEARVQLGRVFAERSAPLLRARPRLVRRDGGEPLRPLEGAARASR